MQGFGRTWRPWVDCAVVRRRREPAGSRAVNRCGQATKGAWGMSRCWKAMKGVEDCEKPGEVVKRAMIPGSLNWHVLNT